MREVRARALEAMREEKERKWQESLQSLRADEQPGKKSSKKRGAGK
jgi:hypothetical protein